MGALAWFIGLLASGWLALGLSVALLVWPLAMLFLLGISWPKVSPDDDRLCETDEEPDHFVAVAHMPGGPASAWAWLALLAVAAIPLVVALGMYDGGRCKLAAASAVVVLTFGAQLVVSRGFRRRCIAGRDGIADPQGRFVPWSRITILRREERGSMVMRGEGFLAGQWLITTEAAEHQLQRRRAFLVTRRSWSTRTLELLAEPTDHAELRPSTYRRSAPRVADELCEIAMDHDVRIDLRAAAAFQVGVVGTGDQRAELRAHAKSLVDLRVRQAIEGAQEDGHRARAAKRLGVNH